MATLDGLPPETFATVLEHLDLAGLCRLRLSSRSLCHLATQDKFKDFCAKHRVLLTEPSLRRFLENVRTNPFLRVCLRDLTLLHPVDEDARPLVLRYGQFLGRQRAWRRRTPEQQQELQEHAQNRYHRWSAPPQDPRLFEEVFVELLGEAFAHLKASRSDRRLKCLRLKIARPARVGRLGKGERGVVDDDDDSDEDNMWPALGPPPAVVKTFTTVLSALRTSQLTIGQLELFCQPKRALGWDVFSDARDSEYSDGGSTGEDGDDDESVPFDAESLRPAFASLHHLALHFCEPVNHGPLGSSRHLPNEKVQARNRAAAMGLRHLLSLPSEPRTLDLHFQPHETRIHGRRPTTSLFHHLSHEPSIQNLQALRLSGVHLAAEDLYTLIAATAGGARPTLARLELHRIYLDTTADIARIFDLCTSPAASPALRAFAFAGLYQSDGARSILFVDDDVAFAEGQRRWSDGTRDPVTGAPVFNQWAEIALRREGEAVRRPIRFVRWSANRGGPVRNTDGRVVVEEARGENASMRTETEGSQT